MTNIFLQAKFCNAQKNSKMEINNGVSRVLSVSFILFLPQDPEQFDVSSIRRYLEERVGYAGLTKVYFLTCPCQCHVSSTKKWASFSIYDARVVKVESQMLKKLK